MTNLTPYQPPSPVHPRSPAAGIILSFFIPGLGSMYAGSGGVGTLILVSYLISWVLAFFVVGLFLLPVVWIWGMIHGHAAAVRWNRDHGIISQWVGKDDGAGAVRTIKSAIAGPHYTRHPKSYPAPPAKE